MFYIVSYDIPDDRRRNMVAKTLFDYGTRVQYSVFECIMDDEIRSRMSMRLRKIISEDTDSIRIYALCGKCQKTIEILGTGTITKDEDVYVI